MMAGSKAPYTFGNSCGFAVANKRQSSDELCPVVVELRTYDKVAMVVRYLFSKGVEHAILGHLTVNQRVPTISEIDGVPSPVETPSVAVELALRQGLESALEDQVEPGSWFRLKGDDTQAFWLDRYGDITQIFRAATGEYVPLEKTSIGDFIDRHMKAKKDLEQWKEDLRSGRAA
jgi:hypothetical protein